MEIALVNGRGFALIDDADAERVNAHRWRLKVDKPTARRKVTKHYVQTDMPGKKNVTLHRFLHPEWARVDHINGDGLDNRQANLREATVSQNNANQGPRFGRKYKGVAFRRGRFAAYICTGGRTRYLGSYPTAEEGARAYDAAAYAANPEHCRLNFQYIQEVVAA